MHIDATQLNNVGSLFPGYIANGQETSTGLVTLNKTDEAPKAPEPQGAAIKPPVLSAKDAETTLVKKIAQQADAKKGGLKERAQDLVNKGPRIAGLYRLPYVRKYARFDGNAQQAKHIIDEAKKNPTLMKRVDPRGALQQAVKKDGPQPSRAARCYHGLKQASGFLPQPAGAPTKTISLRQLPNVVHTAMTVAKLAGVAPGLPIAPLMSFATRRRPLMAPGFA